MYLRWPPLEAWPSALVGWVVMSSLETAGLESPHLSIINIVLYERLSNIAYISLSVKRVENSLTAVSVFMLWYCGWHNGGCRGRHGDSQRWNACRSYGHWTDVGNDPWPCHLRLRGWGLGSDCRRRSGHWFDVGCFGRFCDWSTNNMNTFWWDFRRH